MDTQTRSPLAEARELERKISVAIVLLAAGQSTRMGNDGTHKLLAHFAGIPLVRRAAVAALNADAATVVVVTGHRRVEIQAALAGLAVQLVNNDDYESGMASSLSAGFGAGAAIAQGVLIMLADMPDVTTASLDALIAAFRTSSGQAIVRAASRGTPGNPVILPRVLESAVMQLVGDVGARQIVRTSGIRVIDIDIGDAAILDVDTPQDVISAGGVLQRPPRCGG